MPGKKMDRAEVINYMNRVFVDNTETPTFRKFIMPHLNNLNDIPIKSWGYARIKKEVEKAARGRREVAYAESIPPRHVMALPLDKQLKWEWRFKEAVRIQQRLSFWVKATGWTEEELKELASNLDIKFKREVITQKEYNKRRNNYRKHKEYYVVDVATDLGGVQSFKIPIRSLRDTLLEKKERLTVEKGVYFNTTVAFPRGRKSINIFALDLEHACELLSLRMHKSCYIMRVTELGRRPRKRDYEENLDGRKVFPIEIGKERVIFEQELVSKYRAEISGDTGGTKKDLNLFEKNVSGKEKKLEKDVKDLI